MPSLDTTSDTTPLLVTTQTTYDESTTKQLLRDIELSPEEEDLDEIYTVKYVQGYKRNYFKILLYYFLCIVSLGALPLVSRWIPWIKLVMTHSKCPESDAHSMLIEAKLGGVKTVCTVKKVVIDQNVSIRMYCYRYKNYIYDEKSGKFHAIGFNTNKTFSQFHSDYSKGVDEKVRAVRKTLFGENLIAVPVPNWFVLLIDKVLHPFYIFQIFSIIVWLFDTYYVFAGCIAVISAMSAITTLIETRRNLVQLREMAIYKCDVTRLVDNGRNSKVVSSVDLVPGDVIEIPNNFVLPCDIALLSGQCIVNEAMLTGESIPIIKNPLAPENQKDIYSPAKNKINTLYAGTKVIQTRLYGGTRVLGVVCKTGFMTSKGQLVTSILFPKPSQFRFYTDSLKFIGVMFILGMVGFAVSAVSLYRLGAPIFHIIKRGLDVITITVPPALPVAMTMGSAFAISRLRKSKIFCISPPRVNVSGMVDLMCFDKTGTLTEEGLDLLGVTPVVNGKFSEMISADNVHEMFHSKEYTPMFYTLASCHSLSYVDDQLIGDPLEVKIFEATKWELFEPSKDDYKFELTVPTVVRPHMDNKPPDIIKDDGLSIELPFELGKLKEFEFSSALQRMSVIVKNLQTKEVFAYCKGSPEAIAKLSKKETIPANFSDVLYQYARNGYRVLACGYKVLKNLNWRQIQRLQRDEVECDLHFLGFIIMQNKIKKETKRMIQVLNKAEIKNVMVTGDNAYTAISVARKCKMVPDHVPFFLGDITQNGEIVWKDVDSNRTLDPKTLLPNELIEEGYELAVTGNAFEYLLKLEDTEHFQRVLVSASIFARMSPSQKMKLVEEFQKLEIYVGMCGDGANDCGALKAAHIGVSLSEAEASIAAPFTSIKQTIECIPKVIREGRAALSTSFQMFKYMALYSFLQFIAVILLYQINSNFGDYQFLYVDMVIIIPISALMGNSGAIGKLIKRKPLSTLLSRTVLVSLFGQLLIAAGFQLWVWFDLHNEPWFVPLDPRKKRDNILCFETTVVFIISISQMVYAALAYSISKPFKKPIYTNKLYVIFLIIIIACNNYIMLYPDYYTRWWLELMVLPQRYRFRLLFFTLLHCVVAYIFERFLIVGKGRFLLEAIRFRKKKKTLFEEKQSKFKNEQEQERKKLRQIVTV